MNQEKFCAYKRLSKDYSEIELPICTQVCKLRKLAKLSNGDNTIGEPCESVFEDDLPSALRRSETAINHFATMIQDPKLFALGISKVEKGFEDELDINSYPEEDIV
jgi:hypothetical protein